jgi:hypothetical protein
MRARADFPSDKSLFKITAVRTRAGTLIKEARDMPAQVFAMIVDESYFFPDDEIGEIFHVPLPSDNRTVEVELISRTPRLVLIKDFLSLMECQEIISVCPNTLSQSFRPFIADILISGICMIYELSLCQDLRNL